MKNPREFLAHQCLLLSMAPMGVLDFNIGFARKQVFFFFKGFMKESYFLE